MFDNNRDSLRQFYIDSWNKANNNIVLSPLEQQIVAVIKIHPEYQKFLEQANILQQDFMPEMGESNPFLHMGMHIGLLEQVSTNRPEGIRELYQKLSVKLGNHDAEHRMMDCLADAIWTAQKHNCPPDDTAYLTCLKQL